MIVHCFAAAKEILGATIEVNAGTVGELRTTVALTFPYLVAVNLEYAPDDCVLNDGDEVAIIPPVSGG